MKSREAGAHQRDAQAEANLSVLADLRLRLQGSQTQLLATRHEARRLARELAITRRLLKFASDTPPPVRARPPVAAPPPEAVIRIARQRAAPLTETVIYHLDACEDRGAYTAISGWAFRPAPGWDGRTTTVTLLFRADATVYQAATCRVSRADVAAHFAAQPASVSGGALGLDGVGFACEVLHDSLPAGVELTITLRLECMGRACEQTTEGRLRL